ncbi:Mu-like prophage protein GP36 [Rhodovulum sp. P5]|uniref:phage protein Gp36 family protein n=1 Tax=Rhodovulum sp. P5 TaxID=1564506 RepID=UPI0009C3109A|nr:phage protein Gp36 family protein [Rhodovulum sp. P5]ARE40909.1 Mu-like prophage protein GP36 [Rhodovulum sp. P5]
MSYATLSDLIERAGEAEIVQIADRDRDGAADADVIAAALADADNAIDGYLATRYDTPLDDVPDLVVTWAVSLARYTLHRNGAPDHVEADYKAAIAALKDAARGLIALPLAAGGTVTAGAGGTMGCHPDEVFTADRLRGW